MRLPWQTDQAAAVWSACRLHRSKGREWDHVLLIDVSERELPLPPKQAAQAREQEQPQAPVAPGAVLMADDGEGYAAAQAHSASHAYTAGGCADPAVAAPSDRPGTIEEERRLLYVGMTRARRALTLARPAADARGRALAPSPFLAELPPELCRTLPDGGGVPRDVHSAVDAVMAAGPPPRRGSAASPGVEQQAGAHAADACARVAGAAGAAATAKITPVAVEVGPMAAGAPRPGACPLALAITKPGKHPFILALPNDTQRTLCHSVVKKAKLPAFRDAARLHAWLTTHAKTRCAALS